jgi:DNA-binding response OmpR family regulator
MGDSIKKILIVEDERPIAKALELKLLHSGFQPTVVFDGEAAVNALVTDTFDIMLLDLMMPKIDGFGVLNEIRKRGISLPVIVTSNLGQPEDARKAKELGAKEYFVKSDTPISVLVEKIKSYFVV